MLILLIYFEKNLFDSIFIKLRYEQRDFEIFSRNLISSNFTQFILKLLSLLNITFFSLYFSLFYYNFWLNYFELFNLIFDFIPFIFYRKLFRAICSLLFKANKIYFNVFYRCFKYIYIEIFFEKNFVQRKQKKLFL